MTVTLYSKPNCGLCEELKHDLALIQRDLSFSVVERNIEENTEDFERFRDLIPVLDIENGPLLYPPHNVYTIYQTIQTILYAYHEIPPNEKKGLFPKLHVLSSERISQAVPLQGRRK